jgi:hypothetical protein
MMPNDVERRQGRRALGWLVAMVALTPVVIGFVAYRLLHPAAPPVGAPAPVATEAIAPATPPPPVVLQPTIPPRADLPQLDASDALVRKLAAGLSAHPEWTKWLLNDRIVRRFVAATDNVAEGRSPNAHVGFLAPKEPFRADERGDASTIDAATYRRYDAVAAVVASLDANGCAKLFAQTRPLFQRAYDDLGYPDRRFEDTLAKAIRHLLATPDLPPSATVRHSVKSWKYTDPRFEALSPAQKQLLRMGPDNVRRIKQKLREIAESMNMAV